MDNLDLDRVWACLFDRQADLARGDVVPLSGLIAVHEGLTLQAAGGFDRKEGRQCRLQRGRIRYHGFLASCYGRRKLALGHQLLRSEPGYYLKKDYR
jgi:hypothetical protein